MKKLTLTLILCCALYFPARADYGNCIVYIATFHLNDGRVFPGNVEQFGYEVALDQNNGLDPKKLNFPHGNWIGNIFNLNERKFNRCVCGSGNSRWWW